MGEKNEAMGPLIVPSDGKISEASDQEEDLKEFVDSLFGKDIYDMENVGDAENDDSLLR